MSRAPTRMTWQLEEEIRELERSRRALERGLAEAEEGERRTKAGLAALEERITSRTFEAVPDPADRAIPHRITARLESVCAATTKALAERWHQIRTIIRQALKSVADKLNSKTRELRTRESESQQDRGRDAGGGRPSPTSHGPAG